MPNQAAEKLIRRGKTAPPMPEATFSRPVVAPEFSGDSSVPSPIRVGQMGPRLNPSKRQQTRANQGLGEKDKAVNKPALIKNKAGISFGDSGRNHGNPDPGNGKSRQVVCLKYIGKEESHEEGKAAFHSHINKDGNH